MRFVSYLICPSLIGKHNVIWGISKDGRPPSSEGTLYSPVRKLILKSHHHLTKNHPLETHKRPMIFFHLTT